MSQTNNPHPAYKLFNLNLLCDITGITRDKLYKNMKGQRNTLTEEQKKEIFDILENGLKELKSEVCQYES